MSRGKDPTSVGWRSNIVTGEKRTGLDDDEVQSVTLRRTSFEKDHRGREGLWTEDSRRPRTDGLEGYTDALGDISGSVVEGGVRCRVLPQGSVTSGQHRGSHRKGPCLTGVVRGRLKEPRRSWSSVRSEKSTRRFLNLNKTNGGVGVNVSEKTCDQCV